MGLNFEFYGQFTSVTEETKFPLPVPKNSTPLPKSNGWSSFY